MQLLTPVTILEASLTMKGVEIKDRGWEDENEQDVWGTGERLI